MGTWEAEQKGVVYHSYLRLPKLPSPPIFTTLRPIPELAKLWQSSRRQGDHSCHRRTGKARWAMQSLRPWRNHKSRHIETALNWDKFKDVPLMLSASIGNGSIEREDRFEQDKRLILTVASCNGKTTTTLLKDWELTMNGPWWCHSAALNKAFERPNLHWHDGSWKMTGVQST